MGQAASGSETCFAMRLYHYIIIPLYRTLSCHVHRHCSGPSTLSTKFALALLQASGSEICLGWHPRHRAVPTLRQPRHRAVPTLRHPHGNRGGAPCRPNHIKKLPPFYLRLICSRPGHCSTAPPRAVRGAWQRAWQRAWGRIIKL